MTVRDVLTVVLCAVMIIFFARLIFVLPESDKEPPPYDTELSERIRKMNRLNEQVNAAEEFITETESCSVDLIKCFTLSRKTVTGKELELTLYADGQSDVSEMLKGLIEAERDELVTALLAEAEKIPERRRKNVEKTIRTPAGELTFSIEKTSKKRRINDAEE